MTRVATAACNKAIRLVEDLAAAYKDKDYFETFGDLLYGYGDRKGMRLYQLECLPIRLDAAAVELSGVLHDLEGTSLWAEVHLGDDRLARQSPDIFNLEYEHLRKTADNLTKLFIAGASQFIEGLAEELDLEKVEPAVTV